LPQVVPFVILGTLEKKSRKGSILDVFGAKSEENGKVSKIKLEIVPDGVKSCM
jgi:predicted RNA-binding protein